MGWIYIIFGVVMIAGGSFVTYYGQQLLSSENQKSIIEDTVTEVLIHTEEIPITNHDDNVTVETSVMDVMDKEDNVVSLEVSVISKEAHWAYESNREVLLNGLPLDMTEFLSSKGMQARFNRSLGIIAVGAASEQGNIKREERRSEERANQLVHWLRQTVSVPKIDLYTLSLGRFAKNTGLDQIHSSSQRRIVIISIIKMDEGTNLSDALKKGLENVPSWPIEINEYSSFKLENAT